MQTPGRAVEPQTPMVPLERRMSSAYERLLTRAQEGAVTERPQIRGLGRVILEMEQLNNNMKSIQDEIRRDIRARRKYFEAEKKLLKKDIDNQSGFQAAALFDLRKVIGLASFGIAANEIAQGDLGGAAQGIGLGTAAFLPEIANGVIMILMARGLIGKGGGGMMAGGAVSGGLGLLGGGKGKGILALAALGGLLLTGNALASNSDSRRRQDISETIRGDSTINAPDVARFRSQLTTANSILSTVKDTKEEKQSSQFGGGADIQGQIAKVLGKPNKGAKPAEASTISDSQRPGIETQTPVEPISTVSDSQGQAVFEPISTVVPDTRSDQFASASVQDDQAIAVSPWMPQQGTLVASTDLKGVLPEQNTSNVELTGASKELIGSDKTFLTAIRQLAAKRGINEAQLLGLIASESSFDPTAVNKDTGATGLIQFMPEVAEALGTSQEEILKMTRAEQVALMDQYFEMNRLPDNPTAGQLKTNVLMPSYTNQDDSFELMTRHNQFTDGEAGNPNTYKVNQGLDYNKDGFVTVGEAGQSITNKMDEFGIGDLTNILSKKEKNKLDLGKRAGKNQWWDFLDLFENPKQKQNLEQQQSNEGSGTKPVIINEGGTVKKLPPPPPPLPGTASSNVNVSTTFSGSIDKLESAYALETYAAFG